MTESMKDQRVGEFMVGEDSKENFTNVECEQALRVSRAFFWTKRSNMWKKS